MFNSKITEGIVRGRHGRDRMVVGFTCTISACHYLRCEFKFYWGEVYSIKHYVI